MDFLPFEFENLLHENDSTICISEISSINNVKDFLRGFIARDDLNDNDKQILSLLPYPPVETLFGIDHVDYMKALAENLSVNPLPLYRKMNILIQKKVKENILQPSNKQIADLYNLIDHVNKNYFVGFIEDCLLSDDIDAVVDEVELLPFIFVKVVFIRNSFLESKTVIQECRDIVTNVILSDCNVNRYHRCIVQGLIQLKFPDVIKQEDADICKKRKRVNFELKPSKRKKVEWCSTNIGLWYTYTWKLVFIRNSPIRLSDKGQEYAAQLRNNKTNGKSYESDMARTMEHMLHLIKEINSFKIHNLYLLEWILDMYIIFKLYRAFELQVRYTNSLMECDVQPMENSRKSKEFFLCADKTIRRTKQDKEEIEEFMLKFFDLLELSPVKKQKIPSQVFVYETIKKILFSLSNNEMIRVCHFDWTSNMNETEQHIWDKILLSSQIIAMYTALIRKASSFGFEIEKKMIKIPMLLGTDIETYMNEKKSKEYLDVCVESEENIKKIFGF